MKEYRKPVLRVWGSVADLTRADDELLKIEADKLKKPRKSRF